MPHIIIRDDDTSYFTAPRDLERIYGPLWAAGHPVSLAVIPAQNGAVRVAHRPGQPYDPGIKPAYRGVNRDHAITANPVLCRFLNGLARSGLVEICLHGYNHAYMEYTIDDESVLRRKLTAGRELLSDALPDADIRTFIAPYDRISAPALRMLLADGWNVCTHTTNLAALPDLAHLGPYQRLRLPAGNLLYTCDEYLFTHHRGAQDCLASARQRLASEPLLIVGNHYWTFFYDWAGENAPMLAAWDAFVRELLAHSGVVFGRFSAIGSNHIETKN